LSQHSKAELLYLRLDLYVFNSRYDIRDVSQKVLAAAFSQFFTQQLFIFQYNHSKKKKNTTQLCILELKEMAEA